MERSLLIDEHVDAGVVQGLHGHQGEVLSLVLVQLHLLGGHQVQVQGRVGARRRTDGDLRQDHLPNRLRVHRRDNRVGRPGSEGALDHVHVVAEAGDHDDRPDAADQGILPGGDVDEAVDCGGLEEVSSLLDEKLHLILLQSPQYAWSKEWSALSLGLYKQRLPCTNWM